MGSALTDLRSRGLSFYDGDGGDESAIEARLNRWFLGVEVLSILAGRLRSVKDYLGGHGERD